MSSLLKYGILCSVAACLLFTACQPHAQNTRKTNQKSPQSDPAELNAKLCREYLKNGKLNTAMNKCEKALQQDSQNYKAHMWKAVLHQKLGQYTLAERHFRKAVRLNPKDAGAHNNFGAFLCQMNKIKKAESEFLLAAGDPLYSGRSVAYTNAGLCMLKIKNNKKAELYFRKALEINPKFSVPLLNLAALSLNTKSCRSARGFMKRWSANNRWTARSLFLAVKIEKCLNNNDKAASYGLLLKARFPTSLESKQYSKME